MSKLNKKLDCPKCGFRPTFQVSWKLEYKDECKTYAYQNSCTWDSDVTEHLHQECPDCGYTLPVACEDNETVAPDKWTTGTGNVTVPPVSVNKNAVKADNHPMNTACNAHAGRGVTQTAKVTPIINHAQARRNNYVQTPVVPVKCRTCPVDAEKAE